MHDDTYYLHNQNNYGTYFTSVFFGCGWTASCCNLLTTIPLRAVFCAYFSYLVMRLTFVTVRVSGLDRMQYFSAVKC